MATKAHTVQVPGGLPVVIYAETPNINYFINGDLEPDENDGVTNGQTSVKAHTRKQYPGDETAVNVSASQREYLNDPTRTSGSALPGKNFYLKAFNSEGAVTELRRFTYKGRWMDLHAFLMAEATYDMYAYNSTGARSTIQKTTAP